MQYPPFEGGEFYTSDLNVVYFVPLPSQGIVFRDLQFEGGVFYDSTSIWPHPCINNGHRLKTVYGVNKNTVHSKFKYFMNK